MSLVWWIVLGVVAWFWFAVLTGVVVGRAVALREKRRK